VGVHSRPLKVLKLQQMNIPHLRLLSFRAATSSGGFAGEAGAAREIIDPKTPVRNRTAAKSDFFVLIFFIFIAFSFSGNHRGESSMTVGGFLDRRSTLHARPGTVKKTIRSARRMA